MNDLKKIRKELNKSIKKGEFKRASKVFFLIVICSIINLEIVTLSIFEFNIYINIVLSYIFCTLLFQLLNNMWEVK